MKVIRLQVENVKAIKAIEIIPEDDFVILKGKNGAGKSSVIDAIAYALGGARMCPQEPIRRGENEAKVTVYLGEFEVTRYWKRNGNNIKTWLEVSSQYGPIRRPQQILDELLGAGGNVIFDPSKFLLAHDKEKIEMLARAIGFEIEEWKKQREEVYLQRRDYRRDLKKLQAQLEKYKDVPSDRDVVIVNTELILQKLSEANKLLQKKKVLESRKNSIDTEIEKLKAKLAELEIEREKVKTELEELKSVRIEEIQELERQLKEAEELNEIARKAKEKSQLLKEEQHLISIIESYEEKLHEMDEKLKQVLSKALSDGLTLEGDKLIYKGIPFEQLSSSEQLYLAVHIAANLAKNVRVVLFREGAFLDEDNVRRLCQIAKKLDVQIWVERVGESGDGILIHQGELA